MWPLATLNDLSVLALCNDAQGLRSVPWLMIGLLWQIEDPLASQPKLPSTTAMSVATSMATTVSVDVGVHGDIVTVSARAKLAWVTTLFLAARLSEEAWTSGV